MSLFIARRPGWTAGLPEKSACPCRRAPRSGGPAPRGAGRALGGRGAPEPRRPLRGQESAPSRRRQGSYAPEGPRPPAAGPVRVHVDQKIGPGAEKGTSVSGSPSLPPPHTLAPLQIWLATIGQRSARRGRPPLQKKLAALAGRPGPLARGGHPRAGPQQALPAGRGGLRRRPLHPHGKYRSHSPRAVCSVRCASVIVLSAKKQPPPPSRRHRKYLNPPLHPPPKKKYWGEGRKAGRGGVQVQPTSSVCRPPRVPPSPSSRRRRESRPARRPVAQRRGLSAPLHARRETLPVRVNSTAKFYSVSGWTSLAAACSWRAAGPLPGWASGLTLTDRCADGYLLKPVD